MSLRPDHRSGRSRSKSPGGRGHERARSRSNVRAPEVVAADPYEIRQPAGSSNEPITMGNYADLPPHERPGYVPPQTGGPNITYAQPGQVQYAPTSTNFAYTATAAHGQSHAAPPRNPSTGATAGYQYSHPHPPGLTYTAKPVTAPATPPVAPTPPQPQASPQAYTTVPQAPAPPPGSHPNYSTPPPPPPPGPSAAIQDQRGAPTPPRPTSNHDGRKIVEMVPGGGGGKLGAPPSPGLHPHNLRVDRLSVSGNRPDIHTIVPGGFPGGGLPPPSPLLEAYHGTYQSISPMPHAIMLDDDLDHIPSLDGLSPRASNQSFGGRRRAHSTSRRSPSPAGPPSRHRDKLALEAYGHGDPHHSKDKLALEAYGHGDPRHSRDKLAMEAYGHGDRHREKENPKRRVKIYDAEDDALALMEAIAGRTLNADTMIDILPTLTHDQMLELRAEYKRHCKVQGRGINIAKHIKLKTSGNFGKIAYVTALGRFEGEGYWANYWYQSSSARRELLIESLMGRSNYEIREIKDAFKDKRYSDSLVRCMDKELKADKFRKAVLMALEGERQEESDVWPQEYRNRDVDTLYKAMKMREGGESTMLSVVVMRSDAHLREVLRTYERKYQANFAREALRKSNNLVGEVIAHILNGVINRPARDSMLLHHALMDLIEPSMDAPGGRNSNSKLNSKESSSSKHERQQRYELLISRLVRLHWDRMHLSRVKSEYEEKYGRMVEEDLEEATRGDFREFCIALCQTGR